MDGCPQVEDVALSSTLCMEALEDVLAQVGREGVLPIGGLTVDGAETAALQTTGAEVAEYPQALQNLLHGHLFSEEGEVNLPMFGFAWRCWLDRRSYWY